MDVPVAADSYHPARIFANKLAGYVACISGTACFGARYMPIVLFFSALGVVRLYLREEPRMVISASLAALAVFSTVLYGQAYLSLVSFGLLVSWMWLTPALVALALRLSRQWVCPLLALAAVELVLAKSLSHAAFVVEWQKTLTMSSMFVRLEPSEAALIEPFFQLALNTFYAYGFVCYWVWTALLLMLGRTKHQQDWRSARLPPVLCILLVFALAFTSGVVVSDLTTYRMVVMLLLAQGFALTVPKLEEQGVHPLGAMLLWGACLSIYPIVPWLAGAVGVTGAFGYGGVKATLKKFVSGVK